MKIQHLMEGAEPKMPGAPGGIQIMTPQQFVAKAGDMPGEESEEGVAEGSEQEPTIHDYHRAKDALSRIPKGTDEHTQAVIDIQKLLKAVIAAEKKQQQGVAEGLNEPPVSYREMINSVQKQYTKWYSELVNHYAQLGNSSDEFKKKIVAAYNAYKNGQSVAHIPIVGPVKEQGVAEGLEQEPTIHDYHRARDALSRIPKGTDEHTQAVIDIQKLLKAVIAAEKKQQQGVAEGQEHLDRIRKLSGLDEATKLPASSREFGGDEFQDYMKRIVGTPDLDKEGNVKTDKKGNEKYVSGKTKTDRYKMPYIHRSSVVEYIGPDGQTYSEDKIKQALAQRPKALLKQNEKMKHSNGEFEQFFNVGFAALTGIALDEDTNKLIIVNTCPGAGSCKVDCFAMKGGKVQFKAAWLSDGRILTYLLNDPDGFFNQLSAEIAKEEAAGMKGDKKFPNGWQTTIRWHDAGDFFSPEYLDLALKMAAKHPNTKFYAYTKMAGAALAKKPANFIINWSEGAHTSQEKQVKASDANLDTTKNSRIVPDELFQDLLVKDEKKNLVKGAEGQWQVQPDKLPELKQRLAKEYGLSANSILDYNEYMAKRKSIPAGMKYNVIVAPGEGDISANDPNIISTLLLKH